MPTKEDKAIKKEYLESILQYIETANYGGLKTHLESLHSENAELLKEVINESIKMKDGSFYPIMHYCLLIASKDNFKTLLTQRNIAKLLEQYGAHPEIKDHQSKSFEEFKEGHYIKPMAKFIELSIGKIKDKSLEHQRKILSTIVSLIGDINQNDLRRILAEPVILKDLHGKDCPYPLSHYYLKVNDNSENFSDEARFENYYKISSLLISTHLAEEQTDYADRTLDGYKKYLINKYSLFQEKSDSQPVSQQSSEDPDDGRDSQASNKSSNPGDGIGNFSDEEDVYHEERSASAPIPTRSIGSPARTTPTSRSSSRPFSRDTTPRSFDPLPVPADYTAHIKEAAGSNSINRMAAAAASSRSSSPSKFGPGTIGFTPGGGIVVTTASSPPRAGAAAAATSPPTSPNTAGSKPLSDPTQKEKGGKE